MGKSCIPFLFVSFQSSRTLWWACSVSIEVFWTFLIIGEWEASICQISIQFNFSLSDKICQQTMHPWHWFRPFSSHLLWNLKIKLCWFKILLGRGANNLFIINKQQTSFNRHWWIISDKIRYLTMTDTRKVWMPDTFFR